jgi:hypothetical protein
MYPARNHRRSNQELQQLRIKDCTGARRRT